MERIGILIVTLEDAVGIVSYITAPPGEDTSTLKFNDVGSETITYDLSLKKELSEH